MKLLDYMRDHSLSDEAMASLVGGITSHGIRKLKYGERNASLGVATRIETVTKGKVTPADLVKAPVPAGPRSEAGAAA